MLTTVMTVRMRRRDTPICVLDAGACNVPTPRHVHRLMGDGTLPYRKPTPRCALIDPQGLLRLVGGPA